MDRLKIYRREEVISFAREIIKQYDIKLNDVFKSLSN